MIAILDGGVAAVLTVLSMKQNKNIKRRLILPLVLLWAARVPRGFLKNREGCVVDFIAFREWIVGKPQVMAEVVQGMINGVTGKVDSVPKFPITRRNQDLGLSGTTTPCLSSRARPKIPLEINA